MFGPPLGRAELSDSRLLVARLELLSLSLPSAHSGLTGTDLRPMSLGLSHSLSRYKLKFSPDKVSKKQGGATWKAWACLDLLMLQRLDPLMLQRFSLCQRAAAPSLQVDTMIVQAIGLLDDLDKELNTYAMRVREWYGWHFPEMTKV